MRAWASGLRLCALLLLVAGLAGCMTALPTVTLTGPAGPYLIGAPVTLTATGNPGSSSGLWTYSFSASPACGTFNPATIGPTDQKTVTTEFTPTTTTPSCALTVTLTTASGKTAQASISRAIGSSPTVVNTVPANSTSGVSVTSEITVEFDQAMNPATLSLSCTGEAAGPGHTPPSWLPCNLNISGPTGGPTTFTWTVGDPDAADPANLEFNRAYQLQVTGTSAIGFPMAAPYVWAFDTQSGLQQTKTYSSGNISVPIPDNNINNPLELTINVPDMGTIVDVDVKIRINHTWDADLDIYVIHPDGTVVELSTDNGGSGDNYGSGPTDCTGVFTHFDDEATTPITAGTAPFAGSYQPEQPLSTLDNKSLNGNWKLRLIDDLSGDTGTIYCWQLVITYQ
jgi:subtilisin-like proprotein convertase family protein